MRVSTFLQCRKCKARMLLNASNNGVITPSSPSDQMQFFAKHVNECFADEVLSPENQPVETIVETDEVETKNE